MKYLTLIRSIALLHQYQRPLKTLEHNGKTLEYVEVTLEDIEIANRLSHRALGRSLDELPPQTRRLLVALDEMVACRSCDLEIDPCDFRFTQRDVRERLRIGNTQLKVHLSRLVELEYVIVHQGGRGQQFLYELVYDGGSEMSSTPFLSRLIDVKKLRKREYDANRSDSGRPQVGGMSGCQATGFFE